MTHVPYRGATAAVNEIVAGHVPVGFTGMSSVVPLLADKRVRLLATSTSSRASQLPDVPTVAERVAVRMLQAAFPWRLPPAQTAIVPTHR
jgi:tripartite-type tricarboxylate transporter receptor subunit TctC